MEIAWFTDTWLPNRDGVVTSLLMFKNAIEKKGHKIYVFAPGDRNKEEGDIFYYKSKVFSPYPQYKFPSFFSVFSMRTRKIIKKIEPDIIHSHSPGIMGIHALIASGKFNVPLIFTFHTFVDDSVYMLFKNEKMQQMAKKFFYKWLRYYCKKCSCVIAPSHYVAERISKMCQKHIEVIPTGIDLNRFEKGDGNRIREKYHGKKIILHVGRVVKEKNISLLIDAAPYILKKMDAIFIIVGEGPARKELEKEAERKGVAEHFFFTGFVSDEELADYYKAADVFVFPSLYETQGIVAFEAMAAGVPVVAADAKALPDFIKDGENGYLANPYDARHFAEKIIMALENREIVKKAREFVEQYSIEKMADKLLKIYEKYEGQM